MDERHFAGQRHGVAEVLSTKYGNAADSYWRTTINTIAGQMHKAGLPADIIDLELHQFHDAVQAELCRRSGSGKRPGGSAA